MDDGVRPMRGEQGLDEPSVGGIPLDERMAGIRERPRERIQIARIRQFVQIDNPHPAISG